MLNIGVPLRFVQWTTAWLTNRIARVQLNGVTGRCRTFKEGLPQGSVLSPLLFVLYINDLLWNFSESTMVSAYADDLALACRGRKKEDVALRMQAEVDKVVSWSQQALLTLNAAIWEVAFFSLDNAEAQWRTQITINGVPPSCTHSPTFLGVTYDRRMTFGTHVKKVCQQMLRRTNLLRAVGTQSTLLHNAASLSMQPWPRHPGSRPPTSRSLKEPNFKLPGRSSIKSAPRQMRLSCMKLTFIGSNISLKRWVFSRLTSGAVTMSRTRGEWSWTTAWGYGYVDQTGAPLFLRPYQAWAYWRTIRGITHHPDLTNLGAVHHQLPRRWPMFPSRCRGTSS